MNLTALSNEQLLSSLKQLRGTERETTLSILYHLIELDERALYRDAGYSSLFDYCTRCLRYSEGSAARRVSGARCLRENPELAGLFLEGKVTLCSISAAAQRLKEKVLKVEDISGKSKREVQMIVTPPVTVKPREVIKPVVVKASPAPLLAEVTEPKEERYEIRFSVTREVFEEFERAKAELSNELGRDLSVEAVFGKLLKGRSRGSRRPRRSSSSSHTRYVPVAVREEVRGRDQGQCTYLSADGTRCTEKHYLQLDHIHPFSVGGKSEAGNLRMLCPAHNRLESERHFTARIVHSIRDYQVEMRNRKRVSRH